MKKTKSVLILIPVFVAALLLIVFLAHSSENFNRENEASPSPAQSNPPDIAATSDLGASADFFIENGLIKSGEYRADNYISRIVAVQMISDITGLRHEFENAVYTHPFIDISDEQQKRIGYLYHNNIIDGVTNNQFMEDEICNIDTFLMFLLRSLDYIGGQQTSADIQDARATAEERGLLSAEYEKNDADLLSVNEAFDICYNALNVNINDKETLLTYLRGKGIIEIPAAEYAQIYEVSGPQITPFFEETFDDKKISGYDIKGKDNKTYWYGSHVDGTENSITDDGYLQIAGDQQELVNNQQYALGKDYMDGNESYGMTFTVNISEMGNEGDDGRVIFRVIPRTADAKLTKYYAINYFMVLPLGDYQSNLARCQWSITNTNAPSGTEPLAEAYFLLKENVDYTARLLIENTDGGDVHIAFYIDGADRFSTNTEPLLEYTDASEYKILESASGPAFGNSGYLDAGWGYASRVGFNDIRLYDTQSFTAQTEQLKEYTDTAATLNEGDEYANQWRYLVNHGVIKPYQGCVDCAGDVSVAQFLASAMYLNGDYMAEGQKLDEFVLPTYRAVAGTGAEKQMDIDRVITRYEAAMIISDMMCGNPATSMYASLFNDALDSEYRRATYFAVENSYLLLDENNDFNGEQTLTRQDMLRVFSCAVDANLRNKNYQLQIPAIYSDNAIVQGNKPIPISGKGMSGDTVTVTFHGQTKTATVVNGEWSVTLNGEPYGGPYDLTIEDSGYSYTFRKLYVGEVFVVAGQSNAEWSVYESDDNQDTLKEFNNQTRVRLFCPNSTRATTPLGDTETQWQLAYDQYSEHILGSASAIGVFYIQKLMEINRELENVKIGLIQMTYGGTSIELFLPDCVNEKNHFIQNDNEFIESGFWNGYMDAITPYAARALIYYQGENSAHIGYQYELMLRDYIWGVRQEFGDDGLPIMLVQLAGYGDNYGQDNDSWSKIREIQMRVANTTDNVELVTAIDLSDDDPQNIHPANKRPIGNRLAYLAMDMVYGQDDDMRSASLVDYQLEGNVFRLTFDTGLLPIRQDALGTVDFELQNPGGEWVAAQAKIEGNTLLVWDDNTSSPLGVRYAWTNYPKACLYGENDLPILPFNTTKDLFTAISATDMTTNAHQLKKAYHLLRDNDAVVNLTRNNEFRYVKVIDAYLVEFIGNDIAGQVPGDQLALLKRQDNFICESGTTETVVKITGHALKKGDWLRNVKYDTITEVLEVIDANTVRVGYVAGQSNGNVFEFFNNIGTVMAEK